MKAAGYLRISSEMQTDNWSLDAQRRAIQELCDSRGWSLTAVYSEEARSARYESLSRRAELQRLLDDAQGGAFDVVVVHSLDRWGRNLRLTLESLSVLARAGVAFLSITEHMDYSTPEGRMVVGMLGSVAQYFSDNLAKHTSKGKRERVMQGLYNGDLPYGYRKGPDGVPVVISEEAELVRFMFTTYAGSTTSFAQIAEAVNAQGARTRNKRKASAYGVTGPRPFSKESVRDIISNPIYCGMVRYKDEPPKPGKHEAIIDPDLFERCQQMRKTRHHRTRTTSRKYRSYMLKGLVRCFHCGERLWAFTTQDRAYYRDFARHRGVDCPGGLVRAEVIDHQIDAVVRALELPPSWKLLVLNTFASLDERERIENERRRTQERLHRLGVAYVDGTIEEAEYQTRKRELEAALESLVVPEQGEALNAGEYLEDLRRLWEEMTVEEKAAVLKTMLEGIYVDVESKLVLGIKAKPPFIPLLRLCTGAVQVIDEEGEIVVTGDPEGIRTLDLHRDRVAC